MTLNSYFREFKKSARLMKVFQARADEWNAIARRMETMLEEAERPLAQIAAWQKSMEETFKPTLLSLADVSGSLSLANGPLRAVMDFSGLRKFATGSEMGAVWKSKLDALTTVATALPSFTKARLDNLIPSSLTEPLLRIAAIEDRRFTQHVSAISGWFSRWIAENTPPSRPQLTRRQNGRPNYIEYIRALKETPRTGVFGFNVLFWEWDEGVGTIKGDLLLLSDERANSEARYQAAYRFVLRYIRLRLASPSDDIALKRMIRETSRDELLNIHLPGLVLEVLDECDKPQRIRVGKQWIKGRSGRSKLVRPVLLSHADYESWLRQRVYKRLGQLVQNEYSFNDCWDPNTLETFHAISDLEALTAAEAGRHANQLPWSEEDLGKLPKAQRRYARTLLQVLAEQDDIMAARKKTAQRLKISAANERQRFHRLNRKLSKKLQTPRKSLQSIQ